jgi:hypothetical protein
VRRKGPKDRAYSSRVICTSTHSSLCSSGFASSLFYLSPFSTVLAEGFPKGKGQQVHGHITGRLPPWLDNLIDELRYPIPPPPKGLRLTEAARPTRVFLPSRQTLNTAQILVWSGRLHSSCRQYSIERKYGLPSSL